MKTSFIILFIFSFAIQSFGQYITLSNDKYKDASGNDFYPVVCNYMLELAKDTGNNYALKPTSKYGLTWVDDCNSLSECQQRVQTDFYEIKAMGFNCVRLMGAEFSKGRMLFSNPVNVFDHFALQYEIFPNQSGDPNNYEILEFSNPTLTNNLQIVLSQLDIILSMADSAELKVILITGAGTHLVNTTHAPLSGNYTGSNEDKNAADYATLLSTYGNYFKNNTTIMAYDLYNEPHWTDNEFLHAKPQICAWSKLWYDNLKSADQNHLITMGLASYYDVLEWDPGVMTLDFVSQHVYSDFAAHEAGDIPINKTRYHNELLWLRNNIPMPWSMGETGFVASNNANGGDFPYTWGTEAEQEDFAGYILEEVRNSGCGGMAWWQFQDVFWYDWDPLNPPKWSQNFYGLLRYGNPDVTGSYSAFRKPCVNKLQNFVPANFGSFDMNLTDAYYDPYNFNTLNSSQSNIVTGTVKNQLQQPLKDAVVFGFNWKNSTLGDDLIFNTQDDEQIGKWIYTFSKPDGGFKLVPFNDINTGASNNKIINFQCSAIASSRFELPWQSSTANSIVNSNIPIINVELTQSASVFSGVATGNAASFDYITLENVLIEPNNIIEIKAATEIHFKADFDAIEGSESHYFIEDRECTNYSDFRISNPDLISTNSADNLTPMQIEIQFKKSGRQILEAEVLPNPSDGLVYLQILEKSSALPVNIMVFNMLGQFIKSYETNEPHLILDGINWTKGIYMVAVKSENSQTIKKLIIN